MDQALRRMSEKLVLDPDALDMSDVIEMFAIVVEHLRGQQGRVDRLTAAAPDLFAAARLALDALFLTGEEESPAAIALERAIAKVVGTVAE